MRRMLSASAVIASLATGGCAAVWSDASGARHTVGLVWMTTKPGPPNASVAGEVTSVTTLGANLTLTEEDHSLSVGYRSAKAASIKNNALVLGNPITDISKP